MNSNTLFLFGFSDLERQTEGHDYVFSLRTVDTECLSKSVSIHYVTFVLVAFTFLKIQITFNPKIITLHNWQNLKTVIKRRIIILLVLGHIANIQVQGSTVIYKIYETE